MVYLRTTSQHTCSKTTQLGSRNQGSKFQVQIYVRRSEELLHQHVHSSCHLSQEEVLAQTVQRLLLVPRPLSVSARSEVFRRRSHGRSISSLLVLLRSHESVGHDNQRAGGARSSGELSSREHGGGGVQGRRHCGENSIRRRDGSKLAIRRGGVALPTWRGDWWRLKGRTTTV